MKNLKIKKLLTSLTAIGLAATTTVSVVACSKKQKEENLGSIILNKLKEDTSVLFVGGSASLVVDKIKSIISHDSNLDGNKWNLSGAEVALKDKDGKTAEGNLKKENYNFTVKIAGRGDNSGATPVQVAGSFTVAEDNKKIDRVLLNKFNKSRVVIDLSDEFAVGSPISNNVEKNILDAVRKQFLGVQDDVKVMFKTTGEDAKAQESKKDGHNFKFTLNNSNDASIVSDDFEISFKYKISVTQSKKDLTNETLEKIMVTKAELDGHKETNNSIKITKLKTVLNSKVLSVLQKLRKDISESDFTYKIYTTKQLADDNGTEADVIDLSAEDQTVFVRISAVENNDKLENFRIEEVTLPKLA